MDSVRAEISEESQLNSWRTAFWVFFVIYGVLLVLIFRSLIAGHPDGIISEDYYYPWAREIVAMGSDGFAALIRGDIPDPWGFHSFRPPLYPLVLAALIGAFGDVQAYGIVLNYLFLAAAVVLTHCIGVRISPMAGFVAPLLVMLDPMFITAASTNQSELFFVVCMLSTAYAMVSYLQDGGQWRYLMAAVSFWILGLYVRAAGLYMYLPLVLAVVYFEVRLHSWSRALVRAAVVLLVAAVAIGAWKWRNLEVTGEASFAGKSGGVHLVSYFVPQIIARETGLSYHEAKKRIHEEIGAEMKSLGLSEADKADFLMDFAKREIRKYPASAAVVAVLNVPRMFLSFSFDFFDIIGIGTGENREYRETRREERGRDFDKTVFDLADKWRLLQTYLGGASAVPALYGIFSKLVNGLALVCGLAGVYLMLRSGDGQRRSLGVYLLAWIGGMVALTSLVAAARFRLPISPLVFICAAYALPHLYASVRDVWSRLLPRKAS
jgi:stringent starvation protein B